MSGKRKIKQSLSGLFKTDSVYKHADHLVPKLDYDRLEEELQPIQQGEERGLQSLPAADHAKPDDVEMCIYNVLQESVDKTARDVNVSLIDHNNRLHAIDLTGCMGNIKTEARKSSSAFQVAVANGLNELQNLKVDVQEKQKDLQEFQERHGILRSAKVLTSTNVLVKYFIILALFLVEVVTNASFLAAGNTGGIVSSVMVALSISALNVGSAVLVGCYVTPFLFHRNLGYKLLAVIAFLVMLMASGALNLAVAHYRDVSGAGFFDESGVLAIQQMLAAPFALQDIQSWLLLIVGWLFWVVAVIDAHLLDDNYPGYGQVARAMRDARERYAATKEMITTDLLYLKESGEDGVKQARYELSQYFTQASAIQNYKRSLLNDYVMFVDQAVRFFSQLLESYRHANITSREDVPLCFSNNLDLSVQHLKDDMEALDLKALAAEVGQSQKELDLILDGFYESFSRAVSSFAQLDELENQAGVGV